MGWCNIPQEIDCISFSNRLPAYLACFPREEPSLPIDSPHRPVKLESGAWSPRFSKLHSLHVMKVEEIPRQIDQKDLLFRTFPSDCCMEYCVTLAWDILTNVANVTSDFEDQAFLFIMDDPESRLDLLLDALSDRKINLRKEDIAWVFHSAQTRESIIRYIDEYLTPDTLLSHEEVQMHVGPLRYGSFHSYMC